MEVVDVLDHPALERPADRDVVDGREVLDELAQPDAAGVRADRHAELRRQQQDRDDLVDAAQPAGVDLADVRSRRPARNCLNMTRLWTCSPVATRIGATAAGDRRVAQDVVGARSAPRSSTGRTARSRSIHVDRRRRRPSAGWRPPPASGPGPISSRRIAARRTSSSTSAPTFILNRVQPSASASRAEPPDLVVVVAEPADRGRVGRIAVAPAARPSRSARAGAGRLEQRRAPRPA